MSNTLSTAFLRTMTRTAIVGSFEVYPFFFTRIFNIAEANEKVKTFLTGEKFFSQGKYERLKIVQQEAFYLLLDPGQLNALVPCQFWEYIVGVGDNIGGLDIRKLKEFETGARHFRIVDEFLERNEFYKNCLENPHSDVLIHNLKAILKKSEFQEMLRLIDDDRKLFSEHVRSRGLLDEVDSGVCFEFQAVSSEQKYRQSSLEDDCEGHWKIHIAIDLENCSESKLEKAYNFVLLKMAEYRIFKAKLVAPYINVDSMKRKEFTFYLKYQGSAPSRPGEPNEQFQRYLCAIEEYFLEQDIPAYARSDRANRRINGSLYSSYRNERSRYLEIEFTDEVSSNWKDAIRVEASKKNYARGFAIVGNKGAIYFIHDLEFVMKNGQTLTESREQMDRWDIPLEDGVYISAEAAEKLADLLGSEPYNPFNYMDDRFNLSLMNIRSTTWVCSEPSGAGSLKRRLSDHNTTLSKFSGLAAERRAGGNEPVDEVTFCTISASNRNKLLIAMLPGLYIKRSRPQGLKCSCVLLDMNRIADLLRS